MPFATRRFAVLFLAAALAESVFLTACTKKNAVITVGDVAVEEAVLAKRLKQVKLMEPNFTRVAAATGLIEGLAAHAVLKKRGAAYDYEALVAEREKLENDAKTANGFRVVAEIYGGDRQAMLDVGLLPDLSVRKLHQIFVEEGSGYDAAQTTATLFMNTVKSHPEKFMAAAVSANAAVADGLLPENGVLQSMEGTPFSLFSTNKTLDEEAGKKLAVLAAASAPGTILGVVLRVPRGYLTVKRLEDTSKGIHLQVAVFDKTPFLVWFGKQFAGEKLCIKEATMRFQYEKYQKSIRSLPVNCPP